MNLHKVFIILYLIKSWIKFWRTLVAFWPSVRRSVSTIRPWVMHSRCCQVLAVVLPRLPQRHLWMTVSAASGTGVGGRRVFSACSCFSSGSLFICEAQGPHFTCFELPLKCTAPSAAVCWWVLPTIGINIQGFQFTLANILIPQLGAANRSFARGELAVEDVFWYAAVLHPAHVPQPTQSAFSL